MGSFCTVSSRICRVITIYRNKVDSRLYEFRVLKERDCLAKAEICITVRCTYGFGEEVTNCRC